jgi:hypothetical protein
MDRSWAYYGSCLSYNFLFSTARPNSLSFQRWFPSHHLQSSVSSLLSLTLRLSLKKIFRPSWHFGDGYPRSSKEIVCLLSGKDSADKTKNSNTTIKASAGAWWMISCSSGFPLSVVSFVLRVCGHNGLGELIDLVWWSRSCGLWV